MVFTTISHIPCHLNALHLALISKHFLHLSFHFKFVLRSHGMPWLNNQHHSPFTIYHLLSHLTFHILHFTSYISHLTSHILHFTSYISHLTSHILHSYSYSQIKPIPPPCSWSTDSIKPLGAKV